MKDKNINNEAPDQNEGTTPERTFERQKEAIMADYTTASEPALEFPLSKDPVLSDIQDFPAPYY